jgi:hypothetical protein
VTDAALPRSVGKTAVAFLLPTDALIGIEVRCHLGRLVSIRLNLDTPFQNDRKALIYLLVIQVFSVNTATQQLHRTGNEA